ncbi:MAG TPA: lipopolysaccharide heptosyltransferase I [Terriglobia bacterium]|nr:lipopolysaccharide heptosyltransferase I [Terriglobia bacterium]
MPRILVVRLSSIGDIVHALPAVAALGQSFPEAEITWAIESRFAALLDGNPFVQRVVSLDTLGWRRRPTSAGTLREARGGLSELRHPRADVAVDFQGLVKSAALARLSGATRRVGFGGRWLRERLAGVLYTERVEAADRRHVIEENLALVERLGTRRVPRAEWQFPLPRSEAAELRVEERLAALGTPKFVVINPGAGWTSKRWPPERYAELVRELAQDEDLSVVLTGSGDEEAMIRGILARAQSPRAAYFPSTLIDYIALVRRANLVVGGDTGPVHLAGAVGTPIVALYGPTDPARNGPFAPADVALRKRESAGRGHAHWRSGQAKRAVYMDDLKLEDVRSAIQKRLAAADGA